MKFFVLLSLLFTYSNLASAQNSYLCIPNKSTGFSFDSSRNSWVSSNFNVSEEKRMLIKSGSQWEWRKFGRAFGDKCSDVLESNYLLCNTLLGEVRFNKRNLRYSETYNFGYTDGKNNDDNTPSISIGTCSPL